MSRPVSPDDGSAAPAVDAPAESPRRSRWRRMTVMFVVVAVIVYVAVVTLYAIGERAVTVVGCNLDGADGTEVILELTPTAVDAATNRISATIQVRSFGPAAASNDLAATDLTLVVSTLDGPRTFAFGAGDIPAPLAVRFITQGAIEQWPFDTYTTQFAALMFQDVAGDLQPLPTVMCGTAHVPGWTFTSAEVEGRDLVVRGEPVGEVQLVAHRSPATAAFGLIILALMIVMPVLGLTVAIRVLRGERRAEATLMSWLAAMLFATVPLRTFLPGSPPIGSWVDYLVVLWVVVGLVSALIVYVAAWLRWSAPGERSRR